MRPSAHASLGSEDRPAEVPQTRLTLIHAARQSPQRGFGEQRFDDARARRDGRIGRDSCGKVWLARKRATNRPRAFKIVSRREFEAERLCHRKFEALFKSERDFARPTSKVRILARRTEGRDRLLLLHGGTCRHRRALQSPLQSKLFL